MTIERDSQGKSNASTRYLLVLFFAAALGVTVFSLYLVWMLQWQGPFRDLWEFVPDIEKQFRGEWSLAYFLDAYGGAHRIFFPKLVFFADWYWFGGRNILTIAIAVACQFIYLYLILAAAKKEALYDKWDQLLIATAFLLALFSSTQVSNFLYAMDVQWFMSNLLALTALVILTSNPDRPLAFMLTGILAALCNFTGLMSIVVGTLWLILGNPRKQTHWVISLIAITVCFIYIRNPQTSQHIAIQSFQQADSIAARLWVMANTLLQMGVYLLRYLSSPLSREWPWAGALVSIAAIVTILRYWVIYCRTSLSRFQSLCLLIASGILLSGIATAFGRLIYPNSAIAERYQTLVLPLLPAITGLVVPDLKTMRYSQTMLSLVCLLLGIHILPAQLHAAHEMAILSNRVQLAHTAARAGVLERPYIGATLSHPLLVNNINMVKITDPFLRSQQLGYFYPYKEEALGAAWSPGTPDLPSCSDDLQASFDPATQAWTLQGRYLPRVGAPATLVLTQNGHLAGFGLLLRPEGFLLPLNWLPGSERVFSVFALAGHLQLPATPFLYGLDGKHAVCQQPVLLH